MLSPKDFINIWGSDNLVCFPAHGVESLSLSAEDKAFLVQAGLPADAAPFLTFDAPKAADLPTVAKRWGLAAEFQRYREIGSDGAGNPIALDEQTMGEVVYLDHESRFARILMNKSVRQLAESLLAYRKLIEDTQAEFGPDEFIEGKMSIAARQNLREKLTRIDPDAIAPGCFWHDELKNLDANAG